MILGQEKIRIKVAVIALVIAFGFVSSLVLSGCAEEKKDENKEEIVEDIGIEKELKPLKNVESPFFIGEKELVVAALPGKNEKEKELNKDRVLYKVEVTEDDVIDIERLPFETYSDLTSFLDLSGEYMFVPVDASGGELKVLESNDFEKVDIFGAQKGFHTAGASEIVYKLKVDSLEDGDEYKVHDIKTNESFTLYKGEEKERLYFTYLEENKGVMYSKLEDEIKVKKLSWEDKSGSGDDEREISKKVIVELDYFAESIDCGFVAGMDEKAIVTATEAGIGTEVSVFDLDGNEFYKDIFYGFEGEVSLCPKGESLAIVVSDKGESHAYLVDLETKESRELPHAKELSWCPSGDMLAYVTPLNEVGIYSLEKGKGTIIFK